jgi:hypothetical protein
MPNFTKDNGCDSNCTNNHPEVSSIWLYVGTLMALIIASPCIMLLFVFFRERETMDNEISIQTGSSKLVETQEFDCKVETIDCSMSHENAYVNYLQNLHHLQAKSTP